MNKRAYPLFDFAMNKIVLSLIVLLLINNNGIGQNNLIFNFSFELISDCPSIDYASIDLAFSWDKALSTPDIFNTCSSSQDRGIPLNSTNCYQPARSGNGYAGITQYFTIPRTTEYMEAKLNEKLTKGRQYYIQFFVSSRNCDGHQPCHSDAMGLAFSDTLYREALIGGAEQIPPFTPAVQNPAGKILNDTLNWMEISGCYTATGTEQYAIIGSFKTSANTQSEGCFGVTGSYYYVDDVGVYDFDPLPDTLVLCKGESRTIGKSFLDATYSWNTGAVDSILTINQEGRYIVNATLGNCVFSDTVVVLENDKQLSLLPADTLICEGEKLDLSIPLPGDYLWSDGSGSNQVSIVENGAYTVEIQNDCGVFNHSFEITTETCGCNVYIPNAFSPNGDGNNDVLQCYMGCDFPYQGIRFEVFDRWGGLVYSNKSSEINSIVWDGTFKGKALDPGVYAWFFEYEYIRNGMVNHKTISGEVHILR